MNRTQINTRLGDAGPDAPAATAHAPPTWTFRFGEGEVLRRHHRKGWTRYEKFTFMTVGMLSGLVLGVTAFLHIYNYDLETLSSSTSGSHAEFYKDTQPAE